MKKFKFSLQTVHDIRDKRREQEQLRLADLQADAAKAVAELREIENLRRAATENYARLLQSNKIDAAEMSLTARYLTALYNREQAAQANLREAERVCAAQSETVVEAQREVEATAKLRERQRARYALEAARHEQNALDETTAVNFARKMNQPQ